MVNSEECAILVLSCDKNESLLNIFFDFFHKNWPDCPFDCFLGIEKKNLKFDKVLTLNSSISSFSGRLMNYCKLINRKYIMIVLDDFILEDVVDNCIIEKYYEIMRKDDLISNLTLAWIAGVVDREYAPDIIKQKWYGNYLVNMQVGFWRTDELIKLLRDTENAWQAELYGSIRARKNKDRKFLYLKDDDMMPYKYNRGWLVVKGSWNANEIKRLKLEKYVKDFLDGKKILYDNFGRISKIQSAKIRIGVGSRKILSHIGFYM